ncbi:MAG: bifunctional riboflavin kinase/FAD synthetase [Chitinophagales bacterium]|nr:bifunctional riboflavin kinase/FAD synthetase [Chitinophagales bacterium]
MKVYKSLESLPEIKNAVVTIGTFDGVHFGHQKIIERIREIAKSKNGPSVLITFNPHPRLVLNPSDKSLKLLTTIDERIELLEKYGLDIVMLIPFTREFSLLPARVFIEDILISNFNPSAIVIGYDHKFGHDRTGNIDLLKEYSRSHHFDVEEITKQTLDDIAVSSSKIRNALNEGNVKNASLLLGHHYAVSGFVVKGNQIGSGLGFPTANIELNTDYKLIPANGVYAVNVYLDKLYGGMLNIGHRPTFSGIHKTIEVHIFDFTKDIYGEKIKVEFLDQIRKESKFDNSDMLVGQLKKDKIKAQNIIEDLNN